MFQLTVPRRALRALAILAGFVASAQAQRQDVRRFERIPATVRDAGTYHVATGQWTRGPAQSLVAGAGSDIVFDNTVASGYYSLTNPGETWTASGRLPGLGSPNALWNPTALPVGNAPGSATGCANSYTIDGFQIAYCSRSLVTSVTVAFYESWSPACTTAIAGPPQGGPFALTGLPGRGAGSIGCWVLTIDLAGATQSFDLLADGDGAYLDSRSDGFAWTFTFPSVTSSASRAGMLIAGCPSDGSGPAHPGIGWIEAPPSVTTEAAGYDGTRFDGPPGALAPTYPANGAVGLPSPAGEPGTDALADDGYRVEGGPLPPGCFDFGGPIGSGGLFDGPYANFHLELYAKVFCGTAPIGLDYCAGDGLDPTVTTPCPCTNFGGVGNGCSSSFNALGAHLSASGSVVSNTARLDGTGMNATGNCIFLKGDTNLIGAVVFGDGLRCAGGALIRLRTGTLAAGAASFPDSTTTVTLSQRGGTPVGSGLTAYYSIYYRNAATTFCPPATFNATNGTLIVW